MTTQPIDLDHLPVDEYNSLPFKFDGEDLYLDRYGFRFSQNKDIEGPNWDGVQLCRAWLKTYCRPLKNITNRKTSYSLKFAIETWAKRKGKDSSCIGTGEVITAAIQEHYKVKPLLTGHKKKPSVLVRGESNLNPINAIFNIGIPKKVSDLIEAGFPGYD